MSEQRGVACHMGSHSADSAQHEMT